MNIFIQTGATPALCNAYSESSIGKSVNQMIGKNGLFFKLDAFCGSRLKHLFHVPAAVIFVPFHLELVSLCYICCKFEIVPLSSVPYISKWNCTLQFHQIRPEYHFRSIPSIHKWNSFPYFSAEKCNCSVTK